MRASRACCRCSMNWAMPRTRSSCSRPITAGKSFRRWQDCEGSKTELWEGGIRVPAFVRWPGNDRSGANQRSSPHHTRLDRHDAGRRPESRSETDLDGIDLLPHFAGMPPSRNAPSFGEAPAGACNTRHVRETGSMCADLKGSFCLISAATLRRRRIWRAVSVKSSSDCVGSMQSGKQGYCRRSNRANLLQPAGRNRGDEPWH